MLTDLSKNAEKYKDFWRHYRKILKWEFWMMRLIEKNLQNY